MCTAKWVIVAIGGASAVVIIMSMSIYFSSNESNEIDLGDGDDMSILKESSGFHIIEVDASNNQSWSWLALKLGLICSSALHYVCLTKQA